MRKKVKITVCPVCNLNVPDRRKLDSHLLKVHGKIVDKYANIMDATAHPASARKFDTNKFRVGHKVQGGAPGLGKRKS